MIITHELLLSVGFIELPNRPLRYAYKSVTGRLDQKTGTFYFHGFSPAVQTMDDLKYMKMIIDYNHSATFSPYLDNLN